MNPENYQKELKAIKLLQKRSTKIAQAHDEIGNDLSSIKAQLALLGADCISQTEEHAILKKHYIDTMSSTNALEHIQLNRVFEEAELGFKGGIKINDILTPKELLEIEERISTYVSEFNKRYALDSWDYAIACTCGLFAAMLDILFVRAPLKPTADWNNKVNGTFNQWVQKAFNKVLPPDLSEALSKANSIGAPDSSVPTDLSGAPVKALSPFNHRLRSLSHDPLLGFLFGIWDMINGTCTIINDGQIKTFPSTEGATEGNIFQLFGRMFGHLLSDVNAPSASGNRGMGLPAPFMGILRMFEGIPVGDSNFGRQIEYMYLKGYDFRQFVTTSIPMTIMEVMIRAFYVVKQIKVNNASFGETIIDTLPTQLNPRFRMMLALAYGTSSAVNAGKIYVTQNILNANYASWLGLAWNGVHALKWALYDKHMKLWGGIEDKEIKELEMTVEKINQLEARAILLPS